MLTVIELDVVPVDEISNSLVDSQVSTAREHSGGEPRRNGGVGYDILTWMKDVHQDD